MSELGNLFFGNENSKISVDVEMLDFQYISECKDWKIVNAIVETLKSGKEGHYPELLRAAEDKLIDLLPPKEKKRYLSLSHQATPQEIAEAEAELSNWRSSAVAVDENLNKQRVTNKNGGLSDTLSIPVRGSDSKNQNAASVQTTSTMARSAEGTAQDDEAVLSDVYKIISKVQRSKLEKLRETLGVNQISQIKRAYKAELERTKGNESFRIADNADAVNCYSKSIALCPNNAKVWANRAMAYIRMELFDLAEEDSSVAIHLDSNYVKAYSRRGLVRFKRGKYLLAVRDFKEALRLEPENKELEKLLKTAKDKYREVEGESAVDLSDGDVEEIPMNTINRSGGHVESTGDLTSSVSISIRKVSSFAELDLPTKDLSCDSIEDSMVVHGILQSISVTNQIGGESTGFVRINVVSEDSDEETNDDEPETKSKIKDGFCRISIAETDSSEEDEACADPQYRSEKSKEDWKELGNKYMAEANGEVSKLKEAVDAYTRALDMDPQFLPALNNRAQAFLSLKNFESAVEDCDRVLRFDPMNLKALYRRASAKFSKYNCGQSSNDILLSASKDLEIILRKDSVNVQALQLRNQIESCLSKGQALGNSSTEQRDSGQSTKSSNDFIDVEGLKSSAMNFISNGLNQKAINLLGGFLRTTHEPPFSELLRDDKVSLLHLLATAHAGSGDYTHALMVHNIILSADIDPTNSRALLKRAELQLQHTKSLLCADAQSGTRRTEQMEALTLAEQDVNDLIKASLVSEKESERLSQQLLRLKETFHNLGAPNSATPPAEKTVSPLVNDRQAVQSNRELSDQEKEIGNKLMGEKLLDQAVHHYTEAIRLDGLNSAAYNNRALAYIKMKKFDLAETDAGVVIEQCKNSDQTPLLLKALCRRAQARRELSVQLIYQHNPKSEKHTNSIFQGTEKNRLLLDAEDKLREANDDLQLLLKNDPSNATALSELKLVKEAQKKCKELLTPVASGSKGNAERSLLPVPEETPQKGGAESVANLFSPSSASLGSVSTTSGEIGLIPRATKKYKSGNDEISTPDKAQKLQSPSHSSQVKPTSLNAETDSGKKVEKPVNTGGSATKAPVSVPTERPKTVYEFEYVWKSLKNRPDLFAEYVGSTFKTSTFKKVFKDYVSPDLVSFMWQCIREHGTRKQQLRVLKGYSEVSSFKLALSLLPEKDIQHIRAMLSDLQQNKESGDDDSEISALCGLYAV